MVLSTTRKRAKSTRNRMNIICVVKFVPDVDNIISDSENVRMILNPDDACALSFALGIKDSRPDCFIEIVTMAPRSAIPHMEDLLRLPLDKGTLISDPLFAGSDTFVTSEILLKYISTRTFDCILTGSHSLDGDTSHVPVQLAEGLGLDQMLGIIRIDQDQFDRERAVFDVEDEKTISTYEMAMPGVLSLTRESGYKLPYVKFEDLQRDVSDKLSILTNNQLAFSLEEVGLAGSLTRVVKTYKKSFLERNRNIFKNNKEGIEYIFTFLKERGFL